MSPSTATLGARWLGVCVCASWGATAAPAQQPIGPPGGAPPPGGFVVPGAAAPGQADPGQAVQGQAVGPGLVNEQVTRGDDLRAADPGSWDHVDLMAERLEHLSKQLHDEVHAHLQGHEYFRHMDGHATEVERLATHLHAVAHAGESIPHLRADVIALDTQVHEADEVITQIARRGVLTRHYNGAIVQTRRIVREMIAIQHHLEDDLAALDPNYRRSAGYRPADPHAHDDGHAHDRHGHDLHAPPSVHLPPSAHRPSVGHHDDYHHDGYRQDAYNRGPAGYYYAPRPIYRRPGTVYPYNPGAGSHPH